MKNNIENGDAPRLEAGEEWVELSPFPKACEGRRRRYPFLLIVILLFLLVAVALFGLKIYLDGRNEEISDAEAYLEEGFSKDNDTWQGAFDSEELYESCKSCAVSICVGDARCSGFVFSSDGWIATLEGIVNRSVKGRITVKLSGGESFLVESFRQEHRSGLTLLKINAEGLRAAVFSNEREVCVGEELFSFFCVGGEPWENSLFSGRVALTDRAAELFCASGESRTALAWQIGILMPSQGAGAPLFNSSGELVAIACVGDSGGEESCFVNYALPAKDLKSAFEVMSRGERADDDLILPFLVK